MAVSLFTVVPIQGTYDIAYARNTLRVKIAQQRWSMFVNAHATIALTALGELILLTERLQPVMVNIETLAEPNRYGVKLSSRFDVPDERPSNWEEKQRNLQQAATEFDLVEIEDGVEITVYIWVE